MIKYSYHIGIIGETVEKESLFGELFEYENLEPNGIKLLAGDYSISPNNKLAIKFRKLSSLLDDFLVYKLENNPENIAAAADYASFIENLIDTSFNNLILNYVILRKEFKSKKYEVIDDEHIKNCYYQIRDSVIDIYMVGDYSGGDEIGHQEIHRMEYNLTPQNVNVIKELYSKFQKVIPEKTKSSLSFFDGTSWVLINEDNTLKFMYVNSLQKDLSPDIVYRFNNNETVCLYVDTQKKFDDTYNYYELYTYRLFIEEESDRYIIHENSIGETVNYFKEFNFEFLPYLVFCDSKDRMMAIDAR